MFLQQTIDEYIDNPMGKGSTAIANRNLIKTDLNQRYFKLIDKHKDFKTKRIKVGEDYYFHVMIPSESERENTYDVVIKFTSLDNNTFSKDLTLNRYYMSVFSNCPSFVYTYAYVYNKYQMLINDLKDKYDEIVLASNPVVKNPGEIINYDKSIYFACKYLQEHKSMMAKGTYSHSTPAVLKAYFKKEIRLSSIIMREINKENARLHEEKQKEKEKLNKKYSDPKVSKKLAKMTGTKVEKSEKRKPMAKIKPKPKIKPR